MKAQNRQSGVTLTELMIALSVIAILLTLSAPSFSGFASKRNITGSTNLIGAFFDNVKMEAAKRNSWVTVTYSEDQENWCFGAELGEHQTCDCLAAPETTDCKLDVGGNPFILSNTSGPGFANLLITIGLQDNDHFDINPVRGTLSHSEKVDIKITDQDQSFQVNMAVTPTGRVTKCTPSDQHLSGFQTCI
jgi:prepilin-type N-terminal cleavage/methylation domain-containing protein